jgi:hypothetical protein
MLRRVRSRSRSSANRKGDDEDAALPASLDYCPSPQAAVPRPTPKSDRAQPTRGRLHPDVPPATARYESCEQEALKLGHPTHGDGLPPLHTLYDDDNLRLMRCIPDMYAKDRDLMVLQIMSTDDIIRASVRELAVKLFQYEQQQPEPFAGRLLDRAMTGLNDGLTVAKMYHFLAVIQLVDSYVLRRRQSKAEKRTSVEAHVQAYVAVFQEGGRIQNETVDPVEQSAFRPVAKALLAALLKDPILGPSLQAGENEVVRGQLLRFRGEAKTKDIPLAEVASVTQLLKAVPRSSSGQQ